jgi:hypothetical protein
VSLRFPTRGGFGSWLTVFSLAVVFLVRNAHLQLASDDLGWLRGETPTVFDRLCVLLLLAMASGIRWRRPCPAILESSPVW